MSFEEKRDSAAKSFCSHWPQEVYHPHDLTLFFEKGADWAKQQLGWQPIETAPKDGKVIELYVFNGDFGHSIGTGYFKKSSRFPNITGWISRGSFIGDGLGLSHPSHWRQIPEPPTQSNVDHSLAVTK